MNTKLVRMVAVLSLIGCTSIPTERPVYEPPKPTDALSFARRALEEGKLLEAIAWLLRVNSAEVDTTEVWSQVRYRAPAVFQGYLEESRYQNALNLVTLARSLPLEGEFGEIRDVQLRVARNLRDRGWAAPAIEWALRAAERAPLPTAEALEWRDYFHQERNRGALRQWLSRHPGLEPSEEQREWLQAPTGASDWLQGTVTVLVNRGIRYERGVGVPDMMIGSAFYIDRRGYLLTNYHVIQSEVDPDYRGFSRLFVIPAGSRGERLPARVVGWDRNLDIALVKVERSSDFVFSLVDLPRVSQGERVFVLGSPAGLESTVTSGIVSALNRNFLPTGSALQIDAPVNPGNSGGPVLTADGRLLGIIFAGAPNFEGLNFAINARYILPILTGLYQGGEVKRPWLGLGVFEGADRLEINHIFPLGPAEEAGVPLLSTLLRVNGVEVRDAADVHFLLSAAPIGGIVTLDWRQGETQGTSWVLTRERPRNPLVAALQRDTVESLAPHLLGVELRPMGERIWQNYRVGRVNPNSIGDQLNLSENDLVIVQHWQVDQKEEVFRVQLFLKRRMGGYLESVAAFALPLIPFLSF